MGGDTTAELVWSEPCVSLFLCSGSAYVCTFVSQMMLQLCRFCIPFEQFISLFIY
jgi:hypothetical protein